MDYLPTSTLGEKWPHSRGNVGKYNIIKIMLVAGVSFTKFGNLGKLFNSQTLNLRSIYPGCGQFLW